MARILGYTVQKNQHNSYFYLVKGVWWGSIGGFIGTLVMDIVLMGVFAIIKEPPMTCFSIVGNTVARFFALIRVMMTGNALLGVETHYLVGPVIGALYGVIVTQVNFFQSKTLKKSIFIAVSYVEILSQPILASTPILMNMTGSQILLWYIGSFVMHLLCGVFLGIIVHRWMRLQVLPDSTQ